MIDREIYNQNELIKDPFYKYRNLGKDLAEEFYRKSREKKMKIRVISDLHIDVNDNLDELLKQCENIDETIDITLVAGDTSGNPKYTIECLNKFYETGKFKKIIFVSGNHIVYNDLKLSLKYLQQILKDEFDKNLNKNIIYLENDYIEIDDYIIFGGTLWTDYKLYSREVESKYMARHYMNDFRWGFEKIDEKDFYDSKRLTPEYLENEYALTLTKLKSVCEKFKNKKIIVLTHHCPSELCLPKLYIGDPINSAYASKLDGFILENQNIKLWVCGHTHNASIFKIGETQITLNPHGYSFRNESKGWSFDNCIISI